ncbi:syntaxin Pep12p [[Candida] jaroonii]|uniref:Syntaxin Pep12p n=1 Tax=[Candida] jaroonii TaxID=467808 RepID=A0ACA9YB13_9ASCO|nr:syntaxin Pep12p [[Candida] jaroonii]
MSFSNFSQDLESDARSTHYKDFPEFESSTQTIETSLHQINTVQLPSIKKLINEYDALLKKDDDESKPVELNRLASKITSSIEDVTKEYRGINDLSQQVNRYLKDCESNHEDNDTINYLKQKESLVVKMIKSSLRQFQNQQRRFESFQQKTINKYGIPQDTAVIQPDLLSDHSQEYQDTASQVQQSQVQINYEPVNAEELEQQTLLIQEREREIEQINQDISYINEIYGNLEDIVQEQQFTIDSIEDNVMRYSADTQGASNELRRAERYQRRSNGRMLCCFFILFALLFFIVIVQLIS